MSFGKTTLRRWLPAAALVLALLCPLPVFAARAGAEIPVTVRTDGAACDTVYTVEITPLDNAPAPAQTSAVSYTHLRHGRRGHNGHEHT